MNIAKQQNAGRADAARRLLSLRSFSAPFAELSEIDQRSLVISYLRGLLHLARSHDLDPELCHRMALEDFHQQVAEELAGER